MTDEEFEDALADLLVAATFAGAYLDALGEDVGRAISADLADAIRRLTTPDGIRRLLDAD
jgi:hypothetical protein